MVLDHTREDVLSWFEGRPHNEIPIMIDVLATKGYFVEEVGSPGEAGGLRRILALVHKNEPEGHAVVMDDDESIVDPQSKATTKKTFLDYSFTGYRIERVFIIKSED